MRPLLPIFALMSITACAPQTMESSTAPIAQTAASAMLRDAQGNDKGRVTIASSGGALRLTLAGRALTPGTLAFHVHAVGRCDAPDFTSAGPHWNPMTKQHGRDNPMGAHAGDMPNLVVASDGRTLASADLEGTLAQLLDVDGASVIVHAQPDDYRTDPAGNAGARVACGVLMAG